MTPTARSILLAGAVLVGAAAWDLSPTALAFAGAVLMFASIAGELLNDRNDR